MAGIVRSRLFGLLCGLVSAVITAGTLAWIAPGATPPNVTPPRETTDRELGLKERQGTVKDMLRARRLADDNALYECVTVTLPALRGCKKPVTPTGTRGETEIERPGRDLMTWWFVEQWDGADIFEDPCVDDPRKRLVELAWRKERDYYIEQRSRRVVGWGPIRTTGAGVGPIARAAARPRRCRKPLKPRPDCRPARRSSRIVCGVSPGAHTRVRPGATELIA
jgi:hypothetical protein